MMNLNQCILNATGITNFKKPFQGSTDTSTSVSEASHTNNGATEEKVGAKVNNKSAYEDGIDTLR
jgi:hypothetical protein